MLHVWKRLVMQAPGTGPLILWLMPRVYYSPWLQLTSSAPLVVTNKCLGYISALTSSLQAEAKDVVVAVKQVKNVLTTLNDLRNKVSDHHAELFEEVDVMCKRVNLVPSIPRRCGRQHHQDNTPAEDPATYYRRTITIPLVDHLLSRDGAKIYPPPENCYAWVFIDTLCFGHLTPAWGEGEPGQTSGPVQRRSPFSSQCRQTDPQLEDQVADTAVRSMEKLAFQHHH